MIGALVLHNQGKRRSTSPDANFAESITVDQVLDKYVQAVGGKTAIEKIKTRIMKISFILRSGQRGTLETFAKAPNKRIVIVKDPDGHILNQYGFDGAVGWDRTTEGQFRDLNNGIQAAMRQDAEFYWEIKLKELFAKMFLKGRDVLKGREVYVIIATPTEGPTQTMYFDAQSGLLLRRDQEVTTPEGQLPLEIYFEDYREVDGVKLPFTIRRIGPEGGSVMRVTEIKHNIVIDDAKFNKPTS
jgi:hypothetical protein